MNTYKPVRLTTIDHTGKSSTVLMREYSLFHVDISKMMLSGDYVYVSIEEIPDLKLYNGFLIEPSGTGYIAHDLRVNEGMCFSHEFETNLRDMIDDCLHTLALEEETARVRKAAQLAKEKSR